ncbi:MAG: hypothetical protein JO214_15165 [Frankiaceae bacterium]|nr:hypothetical protein [Frankiaceae bacterium]
MLCDEKGVLWLRTAGGLSGGTWKQVELASGGPAAAAQRYTTRLRA